MTDPTELIVGTRHVRDEIGGEVYEWTEPIYQRRFRRFLNGPITREDVDDLYDGVAPIGRPVYESDGSITPAVEA